MKSEVFRDKDHRILVALSMTPEEAENLVVKLKWAIGSAKAEREKDEDEKRTP